LLEQYVSEPYVQPAIEDDQTVPLAREITWTLDNLGNWVGDPAASPPVPGLQRQDDTDGDGTPDVIQSISHAVDDFNALTSVTTDSTSQDYVTDAAGNVIFDGLYVYQYDAWNRLISVNDPGTLEPDDFVAEAGPDRGKISPDPNDDPLHAIGSQRYRLKYDGLGRLIGREAFQGLGAGDQARLYKTIHYYYDGVRILQEVVETPDLQQQDPATFHTEREYVYGPDYVDEFVLQADDPAEQTPPLPMFMLQDANYNVVALATLPPSSPPEVLTQYAWEPYGQPALEDHAATITEANENLVGHQGLFFHRLTLGNLSLSPTTTGLYYNRNRWYAPHLGRFLSRDPNETALLAVVVMAMNGRIATVEAGTFDPGNHFGSGLNLYRYLSGNPIVRNDPLGLHDPFEEVDQWLDDRIGNALYTLGTLNEGATLGLQLALEITKCLLNIDVFESVEVLMTGQGGYWDAMNIIVSVNPIGKLGKVAGRIGKAFKWMNRAGDTARLTGKAAEHLFKIAPYRVAHKWTRGWKGEIQAHHILEARHARHWRLNPDDVPAVILPRNMHDEITARLRQALPYGEKWDMIEVRSKYEKVYKDLGFSEWLQHIEHYFQ